MLSRLFADELVEIVMVIAVLVTEIEVAVMSPDGAETVPTPALNVHPLGAARTRLHLPRLILRIGVAARRAVRMQNLKLHGFARSEAAAGDVRGLAECVILFVGADRRHQPATLQLLDDLARRAQAWRELPS